MSLLLQTAALLSLSQFPAVTIHVQTPAGESIPGADVLVNSLDGTRIDTGSTNQSGDFTTRRISTALMTVEVRVTVEGLPRSDLKGVAPRIVFEFRPSNRPLGWVAPGGHFDGKIIVYNAQLYVYHDRYFDIERDGRHRRVRGAYLPLTTEDMQRLNIPLQESPVFSSPTRGRDVDVPHYMREYWVPCPCK